MVLEALSLEFRTGCPWELLYADDLVLIADSMDKLIEKFNRWKEGIESKGLKVNIAKTKVMVSGNGIIPPSTSGKWPCSVCRKGVGNNSIFCNFCTLWVHKGCSGIRVRLAAVKDYKCRICTGEVVLPAGQPLESVDMGNVSLETKDKFCYLGDMISGGGGTEESCIARISCGWKKFRELLPLLTSRVLSLRTKGRVFDAYVRSIVLYGGETWAVKANDLNRLERNDMMMVRWMCKVSLKDRKTSQDLRERCGLESIGDSLQKRRLSWFGHVERMDNNNCVKRSRQFVVPGNRGRGRPQMTWDQVVSKDLFQRGIQPDLAQDRLRWKGAISKPV